jgi:cysteine desulfurase/selenocysteine lyase
MSDTIDLAAVRADTPGSDSVIHLNNAGAALPPAPVVDAVRDWVAEEARVGGYELAEREADRVGRVYDAAASLLNCSPDEIAFVENATRAWDMAFYAFDFAPGDRILTGAAEYVSNYVAFLHVAQRTGAHVEVVRNDEHGQLSVAALRELLDERVKLIAVTHVPTNGGLVNPAAAIGAVARAAGVPFLLDACQSAGQLPLDVEAIGCDLLSLTGRKYVRGPRGTGLLYARRELAQKLHPPMIDLHAATWVARERYELKPDARRFENWETNYAGKVGLGVAIDYALDLGLDAIWARTHALGERLRGLLSQLDAVELRDLGAERCGIVSFTVAGEQPRALRGRLLARGVNTWFSEARSTRIDMEQRGLDAVMRVSVHYYNSEQELERFVELLDAELGSPSKLSRWRRSSGAERSVWAAGDVFTDDGSSF